MAKVIGMTGAQGTGKSTLLKALADLNLPNVVVDIRSIPRAVQDEYGKSLADIVKDTKIIPEYQQRIRTLKNLHLDELQTLHPDPDTLIFTDRTSIDFYAYLETWLNTSDAPDDVSSYCTPDWRQMYAIDCALDLLQYDMVLMLPIANFKFVEEHQRGSFATRDKVQDACLSFIRGLHAFHNVSFITELSVSARVQQALELAKIDLTLHKPTTR